MALHARQLAIAAGASATQIDRVVNRMLTEGQISLAYAETILRELQAEEK